MSIVTMESQGNLDEFYDAQEFLESSSSESEYEDEVTVETNDEIVDESNNQNLKKMEFYSSETYEDNTTSSIEYEPNSDRHDDQTKTDEHIETFRKNSKFDLTSSSSAFSAVQKKGSDGNPKFERNDALSRSGSDSLRSLLSQPSGKLSTSQVDPELPPSPYPSPKKFIPSTNLIKLQAKKSSKLLIRTLTGHRSSPSPLPVPLECETSIKEDNYDILITPSSVKESKNESSNIEDVFVGRTSPLARKSIIFENSTENKKNIEEILANDKENGDESQSLNSDNNEIKYDNIPAKVPNEDKSQGNNNISLDEVPRLSSQSARSDEILSADAIQAAEIAALTALSPSSISTEIKQKQLKAFRRLKDKAKKTIKYGNKFHKFPPTAPYTPSSIPLPNPKDYIASTTLPANSVPVKSNYRKTILNSSSNPMLLLQSLQNVHEGPIWCSSFSPDGEYFATGGADHIIHVWKINSSDNTSEESHSIRKEDRHCPSMVGGIYTIGSEIKLISNKAVQSFASHSGDVVDLSWSPYRESENFLLSASTDKTVKLWHISRSQPLLTFQHSDLVTSVHFHPKDENYFLSAGFDKKIRLWSIPKERVHEWAGTPEIITQGRFSPDGKFVVAGLITGQVFFFSCVLDPILGVRTKERQGLRYFTQIHSKKKSQKFGKKVTGLDFLKNFKIDEYDQVSSEIKEKETEENNMKKPTHSSSFSRSVDCFLVTTNDSTLRLFSMDDFCLIRKYKGTTNTSFMINAHFSESGKRIVCGSEIGNVCMWDVTAKLRLKQIIKNNTTGNMRKSPRKRISKQNFNVSNKSCEWFEGISPKSHDVPAITDTHFVPIAQVKKALLKSELFPTLKKLDFANQDFESSMIVTSDYDGTIRVFLRKKCLDSVYFAAGPEGNPYDQF